MPGERHALRHDAKPTGPLTRVNWRADPLLQSAHRQTACRATDRRVLRVEDAWPTRVGRGHALTLTGLRRSVGRSAVGRCVLVLGDTYLGGLQGRLVQDVLRLLARGLSNRDIGKQLFISETTAKFHVGNILRKLQVSRRAEAVYVASKEGFI